jgi:hypothetical protein
MNLKENLEALTTQYKEVADQAAQAMTLKTKLEGAIEYTQGMIAEEEKAEEEKASKKKDKSAKNGK